MIKAMAVKSEIDFYLTIIYLTNCKNFIMSAAKVAVRYANVSSATTKPKYLTKHECATKFEHVPYACISPSPSKKRVVRPFTPGEIDLDTGKLKTQSET